MGVFAFCLTFVIAMSTGLVKAESTFFVSQNRDGSFASGASKDASTVHKATTQARRECEKRGGKDCKQVGHVFHDSCGSIAGKIYGNGWSATFGSDALSTDERALANCNKMRGGPCRLRQSVCDYVKQSALVCIQPIFNEEWRLKDSLDGTERTAERTVKAINYLRQKYCRVVEDVPIQAEKVASHASCEMVTSMFRGDKVYWEECYEE